MQERESLASRLGFILISAGCAIGVGNVWKFPYMAGANGGGMFVLMYLAFLLLLGVPVLTMEFSLGRLSRKSPVLMYDSISPSGSKWYLHGRISMFTQYVLMMFYTMVAGWMLYYFVNTALGTFSGMETAAVNAAFGTLCSKPLTLWGYAAVVIVLGFFVCSFSLQGGLEKVTKYMMLALLAIMVVLAVNGFTMPGAAEGLSFYLKPRLSDLTGASVVAAMNQAFFTLSIGMGSMAIFGSYIGKDRALFGESMNVVCLDTFVALVSGLIIFPACFTYGVEAGSGPALIFITLPNIFNNMALGRLWGSLFFLFLCFAAFSTVLAVFECIIACTRDVTGWSRKKACAVNCAAMLLLCLPCILGFNVWSGIHPLGGGSAIMDLEDFIVSNCVLPLGSGIIVLFCTRKSGLGWQGFLKEANTGAGAKFPGGKAIRFYCSYILPLIILVVFLIGIYSIFFAP